MEAVKKPRSEAQKMVPEKARAVKAVLTDARRADKLKEKEMRLYEKALDTVNTFNRLMLPAKDEEAPAVKAPKAPKAAKVVEPESDSEDEVAIPLPLPLKKKKKPAPVVEVESDEEVPPAPPPAKRIAKPVIDYGNKRFIFS